MKKDSVNELLDKAKTGVVLDAPFFASIQMGVAWMADEDGILTDTMATNGEMIIYYPPFVASQPLPKLKGTCIHEDGHIAFLHPYRRGDRDNDIWNEACDHSLNFILLDSGYELPDGCLHDERFRGMEPEAIYDILYRERKGRGKGPQGQPKPGGQGQGPAQPGKGNGQSIADKLNNGQKVNDPGRCGGVFDAPHKTKQELEDKKRDAEIMVKNAMQAAKAMGKLPGGMERMVEDLIDPTIDWKSKFDQFADTYARNDYNYALPNRRYLAAGWFLPTLKNRELGEVTLMIDASGSVSNPELKALVSEAMGILQLYEGVTLHVIFFDTTADRPIDIDSEYDVKKLKVNKGGGTDYRCAFEELDRSGLSPVVIAVLTDGECNRFPETSPAPVLWVLNNKNREFKPPFGEVIYMLNQGEQEEYN